MAQIFTADIEMRAFKNCRNCKAFGPDKLSILTWNISLFIFDIADIPTPTEPVKRVCYTDDLTVRVTGVKIPDLEDSLNSWLEEITAYLKDNHLVISAPKYSVTLFIRDTHQAKTHPRIMFTFSCLLFSLVTKDSFPDSLHHICIYII